VGHKVRKKPPKLTPDQLAAFWAQHGATIKKRMVLTPEEISALGKDNK